MDKDYYVILGVSKTANAEEIKRAYRQLAYIYHPDKKSGDETKFKEVNEAHQVLSDAEKRRQYDRRRTFDSADVHSSNTDSMGTQRDGVSVTTETSETKLPPVGSLLKEATDIYKGGWQRFLGITAIPGAISLMALVIDKASFLALFAALAYILGTVLSIASGPALLYAMTDPSLSISDAYKKGFKLFFPYLWVSVLSGFIVLGGLPFLLVPALIFGVWLTFAPYILIFEGDRGLDAATKSRAYVRDNFGPVLWRISALILVAVAFFIIVGTISHIAGIIGDAPAVPGKDEKTLVEDIFGTIAQIFITPLFVSYGLALYRAFKSLKPELAGKKETEGRGLFIASGIFGVVVFAAILALVLIGMLLGAFEPARPNGEAPCFGEDCIGGTGTGLMPFGEGTDVPLPIDSIVE